MRNVDRFVRALPLLYLVWALPLPLTLSLLIPPAQQPDEHAHFLRTAQIAAGHPFGHRFDTTAGGQADTAVLPALVPFFPAFFRPEVKVSNAMYAAAGLVRLQEYPAGLQACRANEGRRAVSCGSE